MPSRHAAARRARQAVLDFKNQRPAERAVRAVSEQRARRRAGANRSGRAYAFGSLSPILPGEWPEVARVIRRFPTGASSPLAVLPEVHFGRWVVIDELKTDWAGVPRDTPQLNSQYVLFDVDLTVPDYDDYELPRAGIWRALGWALAGAYSRWCLTSMVEGSKLDVERGAVSL